MLGRRPLPLLVALALLAGSTSALFAGGGAAARVQQMYEASRERHFPGVAELGVSAARALADSVAVVWLDVRSDRERRVSVIEGAIDMRSFRAREQELVGRPVIVYCTIGHRSGLATRDLREEGREAYNLAGGVLAWIHGEGDLVEPLTGANTRLVHVYGRRWNLAPPGWRSVW
jgi:rhodanese-related sulfurtransferase